ncbi:MAG: hypothetical protein JSS72_08465 [Armatimonadetes bacterium]|nr:hypothetical protein [Armatimonadota bacterium]
MKYELWKTGSSVLATFGLYSVLYRENKFYRFFEHIFLGLAAGWTLVVIWVEIEKDQWWGKMLGANNDAGTSMVQSGYWLYAFLVPIGVMGYFVFSKKHNWISKIPIGIVLGLYAGQQFQAWLQRYGPQISTSLKPILPTTFTSITVPDNPVPGEVYFTQALTNAISLFTLLSVVAYFLFSFNENNKLLNRLSTSGRWLLMIGFGAIFGTTVTMRFTLLIDRMHFVWIDFVRDMLLRR